MVFGVCVCACMRLCFKRNKSQTAWVNAFVLQKKQKLNCLSQYILFQNECILQQTDPTPRRYANSGEVQVNESMITDVKMLTERIALSWMMKFENY